MFSSLQLIDSLIDKLSTQDTQSKSLDVQWLKITISKKSLTPELIVRGRFSIHNHLNLKYYESKILKLKRV